MTIGRKVVIDAATRQRLREIVVTPRAATPRLVPVAKLDKGERRRIERLIAQLEDPKQTRDSFKIPSGNTREFSRGYVEGAQMNAKATAATLRDILGIEKTADAR
jgi:hypothetical protein